MISIARPLCFSICVLGLLGVAYFGWALHRLSGTVLIAETQWPRPWPYPDEWLLQLNNQFEEMHPAPPGGIKYHGELPRVRQHVWLWFGCCFFLVTVGSLGQTLCARLLPNRGGRES